VRARYDREIARGEPVDQRKSCFIASRAGLFNSAIHQSGTAVNTWAMSYRTRELAFKLGDKLGIETGDTAELVARLAGFNAKELIAASEELMKTEVRERRWLSSLFNARLSSGLIALIGTLGAGRYARVTHDRQSPRIN